MQRIITTTLLILFILVVTILVAPGLIDWSKHKDRITSLVKDRTGYELTIDGKIDFALLPSPHFMVSKLAVSVPGRDPFLNIRYAEISLAVRPLFNGDIDVEEVIMRQPSVVLGVAADGTQSWIVPGKQAVESVSATPTDSDGFEKKIISSISLRKLVVENGNFKYSDVKADKNYEMKTIDATVQADTLRGPFTARGLFMRGAHEIDFDFTTGQLEQGKNSISLKGDIILPSQKSLIHFAGVVANGEKGIEAQGETSVNLENLAAFLDAMGIKSDKKSLAKPVEFSGMMTATPELFSCKGAKISYGGQPFTGDVQYQIVPGKKNSSMLTVNINAENPINILDMLPARKQAATPAPGAAGTAAPVADRVVPRLLPESITLPEGLTAEIIVNGAKLLKAKAEIDNYVVRFNWKNNAGAIEITGWLPSNADKGGEITLTGQLSFASASSSQRDRTITLVDPSLAYALKVFSPDANTSVLQFVPEAQKETLNRIVDGDITIDAVGTVKPSVFSIDNMSLSLQRTMVNISAAYKLAKRDAMALSFISSQIDLDRWLDKILPEKKVEEKPPMPAYNPEGVSEAEKSGIAETVKKISLPFDLKFDAKLNNVHLKEVDYNSVSFTTILAARGLEVRNFEMADLKGNRILMSLNVANLRELKDITFNLEGKTDDAKTFLSGLGVDTQKIPPSVKSADLVSSMKGQADHLDFTVNLRTMGGKFDFSGVLSNLLKKPALGALTARLAHPNYTDIARIFNPDFKSGISMRKDIDLYAVMSQAEGVYNFSDIRAVIGGARISGKITADTKQPVPAVVADLQAADLPLSQILGAGGGEASVGTGSRTAAAPLVGGGKAGGRNVRWSREPIDVSWMRKFTLDLKAKADLLTYGTWQFGKTVMALTLKDGALTLTQMDAALYGGTATITGRAISPVEKDDPLLMDAKIALKNISLESFVSSFSGARLIKAKGNISFDADVKSEGNNSAALVSGLNGAAKASGNSIVFDGFDLARLSRAFAQPSSSMKENLNTVVGSVLVGGETSFSSLSGDFPISTGVISISPLKLSGPNATVTSTGSVNLPFWTLSLENEIVLAEPPGVPPLKISFSGPLGSPVRTFGQSAAEGYMKKMIVPKLENAIMNKLQDKLQDKGILSAPAPAAAPPQGNGSAPAPADPAPVPAAPAQQFLDVIQDVIKSQ